MGCELAVFNVCDVYVYIPWAPKTMKNRGFGHLKTRLFTIKTSKHVGLGGPWYIYILYPAFVVNQILNQHYRPFPAPNRFSWSKPQYFRELDPFGQSWTNQSVIFLATFRYMTYNRQVFECKISHPFEAPLRTLFRWLELQLLWDSPTSHLPSLENTKNT